jgi:hypothetical protein
MHSSILCIGVESGHWHRVPVLEVGLSLSLSCSSYRQWFWPLHICEPRNVFGMVAKAGLLSSDLGRHSVCLSRAKSVAYSES